jgi:hypothetical protein
VPKGKRRPCPVCPGCKHVAHPFGVKWLCGIDGCVCRCYEHIDPDWVRLTPSDEIAIAEARNEIAKGDVASLH